MPGGRGARQRREPPRGHGDDGRLREQGPGPAASQAVLVSGVPGSGKTTVGTLLARRMTAALLDLDSATGRLTSVIGTLHGSDDLDDPDLARLTRAARYETLTLLAEDNLAAGLSVVLVAPFTTERRDPEAWTALVRRLQQVGADTTMVWLRIAQDEALRRVEHRGAGRDLAKSLHDWPAGLDLGPPAVPHLEVDATLSPTSIGDRVLSSLGWQPLAGGSPSGAAPLG